MEYADEQADAGAIERLPVGRIDHAAGNTRLYLRGGA
jgi:hypothetical protein